MSKAPPPEVRPVHQSVGRFLRRLFWRRDVGPVSAEARVEVRELTTDPAADSRPEEAPPA